MDPRHSISSPSRNHQQYSTGMNHQVPYGQSFPYPQPSFTQPQQSFSYPQHPHPQYGQPQGGQVPPYQPGYQGFPSQYPPVPPPTNTHFPQPTTQVHQHGPYNPPPNNFPQQPHANINPQPPPFHQPIQTPTPFNPSSSFLHGGNEPMHIRLQSRPSFANPQPSNYGMAVRQEDTPSSTIEIRFRCKGLKKSDLLSESDPFLVVYFEETTIGLRWRELGRTETIKNTANPSFTKAFEVDYFFEELQRLRIEVFDRDSDKEDLSRQDFLGCVELTLGQLMSAQGQSMVLALLQRTDGNSRRGKVRNISGHIIVSGEELSANAEKVKLTLAATKVDNTDGIFGRSDPFLNIYKLRDGLSETNIAAALNTSGAPTILGNSKRSAGAKDLSVPSPWIHVWQSEVIKNTLNPKWREADLSIRTLCNGNMERKLKIECVDWESSGKHQFIGAIVLTANEFLKSGVNSWPLINAARKEKKGKRYVNSGTLNIVRCTFYREPTFLEYLKGGCEINFIVGIDYTASNGAPQDAASLHYLGNGNPNYMNAYQAAISAIGSVLEAYDRDRKFPVYGFGGLVNNQVSHCFPVNHNPAYPEVDGIHGILHAYANSFAAVHLHGPTNFAPLIRQAITTAVNNQSPDVGVGCLKYFILMILTDGVIMDMQQTVDAIVEASYHPLSIIIVGVGDADFSNMNVLDGDDVVLHDSRGRKATRDIVQFVPFNKFKSQPARLTKETLAEIPDQLTQYYKSQGIQPNPPLQRMGTVQIIRRIEDNDGQVYF